jgi:hypothetical protein
MVARRVIDIEERPELAGLMHEIDGSDTPVILRKNGKEVAEIRAIPESEPWSSLPDQISPKTMEIIRRRRERLPTPEEIEIAKSAAGGWADMDTEKLKRDIYEDRMRDMGRDCW